MQGSRGFMVSTLSVVGEKKMEFWVCLTAHNGWSMGVSGGGLPLCAHWRKSLVAKRILGNRDL